MTRVAALYVATTGPYMDDDLCDPWDETRDAREYAGPLPVVAHPPCERWGRYWSGGPSAKERRIKGDDNGCFAAALAAVRRWGGVLEHPEASHAWAAFGLARPPRSGGWVLADEYGYTCCVEQGHYGHRARKATWLYCVGLEPPPELKWGPSPAGARLDCGYNSKEHRARAVASGEHATRLVEKRLSDKERLVTPEPFRDLLIELAAGATNYTQRVYRIPLRRTG